MPTYEVTKRFTAGALAGLTITERTSVRFVVGRSYGAYVVVACVGVKA